MQRQRKTLIFIEMLRLLLKEGDRILDIDTTSNFAQHGGISKKYLLPALTYLKHNNYFRTLKNDLYALDIAFRGGIPLHEHEIATFIVKPAAISHFSLFQFPCGGIQEVLYAFKNNVSKINLSKIVEYALKWGTATAKRLRWVLNNLKIDASI